jgi:hypothetical protein
MQPFRAHQRFSSTLALTCAYVLSIITGTFDDAPVPLKPQSGIRRIRSPKTFNTYPESTLYRTYSTGDGFLTGLTPAAYASVILKF